MAVTIAQRGLLLVISGPSGTGKGTVIKSLRKNNPQIAHLPSATTREPRPGEKDGMNYFFKSKGDFLEMVKKNQFIEWVEYCGNFYGTPNEQLEKSLEMGLDVVLEKDVDGALKIKKVYPDSIIIFIIPPSFKELKRRIEARGTESAEIIEKRLSRALEELKYIHDYDYVVVNNCVEKATNAINCIINAEKLKTKRNRGILEILNI